MCCSISGIAITGKRERGQFCSVCASSSLTDILWLDVCVNQIALFMQVLETKENLFGDNLDQSHWDPGLVIPFDEGEKVFSEWLKNDADMDVLGCAMMERIEERNDVLVTRVGRISILHSTEQLDLVSGGFGISASRFDHLEGRMTVGSGERGVMSIGTRRDHTCAVESY